MTLAEKLAVYGPALCVCGRRLPDRHRLTCGKRHETPADMEVSRSPFLAKHRRLVSGSV